MPSYQAVQSVLRALAVLEELNRRRTVSIAELHRATGLPKPTLVRLLETLVAAGYVTSGQRLEGYQVTSRVTKLSAGYHGGPLVVEAGRPFAIRLTRRLKWPAAIAVLEQDAMVICFSTIPDSPMAPIHSTVGLRLSLVARALGRAYLAFCPDDERETLLRMLAARPSGEDNPPDLMAAARAAVTTVRRQGFAERDPQADPRNSNTVAMPVREGDRVVATLGIGFYRSAVSDATLRDDILPDLRTAIRATERRLVTLRGELAAGDISQDEMARLIPSRLSVSR
jgi:IclR family mhp operon transcriptional activator